VSTSIVSRARVPPSAKMVPLTPAQLLSVPPPAIQRMQELATFVCFLPWRIRPAKADRSNLAFFATSRPLDLCPEAVQSGKFVLGNPIGIAVIISRRSFVLDGDAVASRTTWIRTSVMFCSL
jgi:hypothetical protein